MILCANPKRAGSSHILIKKHHCTLQTPKVRLLNSPSQRKCEFQDAKNSPSDSRNHGKLDKGHHSRSSSMNDPYAKTVEQHDSHASKKYSNISPYKASTAKARDLATGAFGDTFASTQKLHLLSLFGDSSLSTKELADANVKSAERSRPRKLLSCSAVPRHASQVNLPVLCAQKTFDVTDSVLYSNSLVMRRSATIRLKEASTEPLVIKKNSCYMHNFAINAENSRARPHSMLLSKIVEQLGLPASPPKPKAAPGIKRMEKERISGYKISLKRIKELKLPPNKFQDPLIRQRLDRLNAGIKKLKNIRTPQNGLNLIIIK